MAFVYFSKQEWIRGAGLMFSQPVSCTKLELPRDHFQVNYLEFYVKINLWKSGILENIDIEWRASLIFLIVSHPDFHASKMNVKWTLSIIWRIRQAIHRVVPISLTEHLRSKTHQKPLKDKIFISLRSNRSKKD